MLKKFFSYIVKELCQITDDEIIDRKDFQFHEIKYIRLKAFFEILEQSYPPSEMSPRTLKKYLALSNRFNFLKEKLERWIKENG